MTKPIYQDGAKRGAIYPKRQGHSWQYAVVEASCAQVGITRALEPIPPEGRGWYYVCCTIQSNFVFHFWKRRRA